MGLLAFIIIGLLSGLLARSILPGRNAMGPVSTTLSGLVGSLAGGLIGSLFVNDLHKFDLHPSGILLSVLGAVVVLALASFAGRHRLQA